MTVQDRLPNRVHEARPWRIHELVPDFRLEDVWALPARGEAGEFPLLVEGAAAMDPSQSPAAAVRMLFALRWRIGALLGWDGDGTGVDGRIPSLLERLPPDLRDGPRGPSFKALPFAPLYLLDDEFAAEIANRTMHGVMHLGWVEDGAAGHRGEMAVYVKPNGALGRGYMAAIAPFRHRIVYPPMLREVERSWDRRTAPGPG